MRNDVPIIGLVIDSFLYIIFLHTKVYKACKSQCISIHLKSILSAKVQPDRWMMWVAAQMPQRTAMARSRP